MKKIRIGINGFGRIGRLVMRAAALDQVFEVVAINASYAPSILAHLLKYDTIHRVYSAEVTSGEKEIYVNDQRVLCLSDRDPRNLPWGDLGVDIVIEATGKFKDRDGASLHLASGAKKVVITAPAKNEDVTIVMGVNEQTYDPANHHIISNASCTTNCLAPVAKVLHEKFGIISGMMTTVHAYTNDQKNLDNPHKDLRRARACAQSIIPTTTGAAKAVGKVLPELNGRLNGLALRVPTPNVSVVDLVADFEREVSAEAINTALKEAAAGVLKGILAYTEEPLVSSDFIGHSASSIVDGLSTMAISNHQAKVLAWYDNEWGYSCRVVDLARYIGERLG